MGLGLIIMIEHIVHHEVETGGEVRHIATEGLKGIDRYLQTTQVHTIVGFEELLHICIFVTLHLFGREALTAEVLESLVAYSIHRLRRMIKDHLPSLLIKLYILLL